MSHEPEPFETFKHKNATIKFLQDTTPQDPMKEWDNELCTMACWHRNYDLGTEQKHWNPGKLDNEEWIKDAVSEWVTDLASDYRDYDPDEHIHFLGLDNISDTARAMLRQNNEGLSEETAWEIFNRFHYVLPLYLYDHGNITMSTGSFHDTWDSGRVGFIYMTKEKAEGNGVQWPNLTGKTLRKSPSSTLRALSKPTTII
jgi:hypothetical protein